MTCYAEDRTVLNLERQRTGRLLHALRALLVLPAIVVLLGVANRAVADQAIAPTPPLQVVKHGDALFLRSVFSPREHLVVRVGKGSNRQINFSGARLIAASAGMTEKDLTGGRLIHGNGDDSTPWNINGTYIGANHGCSALHEVTCPGHGRTAADLGSRWEGSAGSAFTLIKILDGNRLWFLPENFGNAAQWKFRTTMAGPRLTCKQRGATLTVTQERVDQLRPACRIKKQQTLVDGTSPLEDARPVTCGRLDVVEEYDIINPASVLRDVIEHPGSERDFAADHLDAVIANRIVYSFYPNGANVIHHTAQALQEFALGYMGFIQSAKLTKGDYDTHEYYIPKTVPFTQDGLRYDFRSIRDYSSPPPSPLQFSAAKRNIEDPANPPDRFIQFLGRKDGAGTVREVGYALGYSLIHGLSTPRERARDAGVALTLYTSTKTYPVAIDGKRGRTVPAGTQFDCVAYRQYFSPADEKAATCVTWHEEDGDTVVYADYHRRVDRQAIRLPAALTGRTITVIEKTPSVAFHGGDTVPSGGPLVSVDGDYGYVVFKVK